MQDGLKAMHNLVDGDLAIVMLSSEFDYTKWSFQDAAYFSNFFYYPYPMNGTSGIKKIFYSIHGYEKINRRFKIPLQSIWNAKEVTKGDLQKYKRVLFIYSFRRLIRAINSGLVDYLRRNYPDSYHVVYWDDLVPSSQMIYLNEAKDIFDLLISYDRQQSKKYGFEYHHTCSSYLPFEADEDLASDVLFVGKAKDRLAEIHQAYDALSERGYKLRFYVAGVKQKDMIKNGIIYNNQIPYLDVLRLVRNTRCILDLSQHGAAGSSLRMNESCIYGRKLLSNNRELINCEYYDPTFMRTFDSIGKQEFDFIDSSFDLPDLQEIRARLSPVKFIEDIFELLNSR